MRRAPPRNVTRRPAGPRARLRYKRPARSLWITACDPSAKPSTETRQLQNCNRSALEAGLGGERRSVPFVFWCFVLSGCTPILESVGRIL